MWTLHPTILPINIEIRTACCAVFSAVSAIPISIRSVAMAAVAYATDRVFVSYAEERVEVYVDPWLHNIRSTKVPPYYSPSKA